ncbi:uncharacterized protein (UPF0548 family) [Microbacterium pseudoresistens]|uniref:Uncharacterized protein (UPF0548 family) n=1 Tax=Microbacterium pseudoresistens TaxID=640634 RepID=A0A7Y9EWV8_9MICO|nr:uncharacterized protein (UPF0548 family) [Microbacterium pseudoresistens]
MIAAVGHGDDLWNRAAADLLRWKVKRRSGFSVDDAGPVRSGARPTMTARVLGVRIPEPIEVLDVTQSPDRVGFVYRTLPGHPVDGCEAFLMHRAASEDTIFLTIRSLTRASDSRPWRALFPLLALAQRAVRRRYLKSLR